MLPVPPPKKILSYYTHKNREDRISQRIWYENVTYPDLIRSLKKKIAISNRYAKETYSA
jgi:hypothetical protein